MSKTTNKFSPEVRSRAVRMVLDHGGGYPSRWAAVVSVPEDRLLGSHLNDWAKKTDVDGGRRAGVPSEVAEKLKALKGENRELPHANEILRKAFRIFSAGGARPPTAAMIAFIDCYRGHYGIEPICRVLPIAASTYHEYVARRRALPRLSVRAKRDEALKPEVMRSLPRTSQSMVSGRFGGRCSEKDSMLLDVRRKG